MRRFAVDELGLPSNDSYTHLRRARSALRRVERRRDGGVLRRPAALVLPVRRLRRVSRLLRQAPPRIDLRPELAADGLDVHSGGSTAYSTLGYFDDPVLSTMVNGGEQYVASLLFHELAHQQLYVKDDSEFSEAFAMVVEELGTERWLSQHGDAGGSRALSSAQRAARAVRRAHRRAAGSACVRSTRAARSPEQLRARQGAGLRHVARRVRSAEGDAGKGTPTTTRGSLSR